MNRLLGDLAGNIGVHAKGGRAVDKALTAAAAPGDAADLRRSVIAAVQRRAPQSLFDALCQRLAAQRCRQLAPENQRLHFAFYLDIQQLRQLGVIAQRRVRVERQMPAVKINVVRQQRAQAVALHAFDDRWLAFPEVTVMHQNRIGVARHGFVHQRLRGGNAGNQGFYLCSSLNLQSVRRVVAKSAAV